MRRLIVLLSALLTCDAASAQWTSQASVTRVRLRGIIAVSGEVAWASGDKGTFVRTVDGGKSWQAGVVPDASALDFRDVHGVDDRTAYLLAIGPGERSRIYKTDDGGKSWRLQFLNRDPKAFYDAFAFWDADHGIALGDPVDGRFALLATENGGRAWERIAIDELPAALPGEGAFAASGTCLVTQGERNVWFGTGGARARVFRSTDRGRTWTVATTPLRSDTRSSGVFSLAFRDADHGVAVGGDYTRPDDRERCVATTADGGRTWTLVDRAAPSGFRSAVVYVPGASRPTLVTVGPSGSDRSVDDGSTWTQLGRDGYHAISLAGPSGAGWAVGEQGAIARLRNEEK
jgi:photosystem II stability/assembly factor-like uncharacterized protein